MNFTPGPWETNTEDSERGHSIFAANDELVATAWFVWDNDNEGRQANNAKLIAAAPCLLEACKHLVNNLPDGEVDLAREVWGNTNVRIILDALSLAREAIAKATQ